MKTLKQTSTTLKIRLSPHYIAISIPLLFTLLFLKLGGDSLDITLTRSNSGNVSAQIHKSWLFIPGSDSTVGNVVGALIEKSESRHSRSANSTFRVTLETGSGSRIPMTSYYTSGYDRKKRVTDNINSFVKNSSEGKFFARVKSVSILFTSLGSFTLFLTVIMFLDRKACTIDIENCIIDIRSTGSFPATWHSFTIDEVSRFEVEKSSDHKGNRRFRTVMILEDDGLVPFGRRLKTFSQKRYEIVDKMNEAVRDAKASKLFESAPSVQKSASLNSIPLGKTCSIFGKDCSNEPRLQSPDGQYFHQNCYN